MNEDEGVEWGGMGGGTHDECGALLAIGLREHEHGVQDLDARLRVDVDALVLLATVCRNDLINCIRIMLALLCYRRCDGR